MATMTMPKASRAKKTNGRRDNADQTPRVRTHAGSSLQRYWGGISKARRISRARSPALRCLGKPCIITEVHHALTNSAVCRSAMTRLPLLPLCFEARFLLRTYRTIFFLTRGASFTRITRRGKWRRWRRREGRAQEKGQDRRGGRGRGRGRGRPERPFLGAHERQHGVDGERPRGTRR